MVTDRLVVWYWIVEEVLKNIPGMHLDLFKGELAPKSRARGRRVGEGRPAVEWARFIKIPCLWEAAFEVASHFPGTQTTPDKRRRHKDPRYARAAAVVARNWLVSLRLPCEIIWTERIDDKPANLIYIPGSGRWVLSTEKLHRILDREPHPGVTLE